MAENEFADRVALVTGASRGIGREIALRLARGGAAVAVNYAGNAAAAEETRRLVESEGGRCMLHRADVADEQAVVEMIAAVEAELGAVELLVTNAGVCYTQPHTELSYEHWQRTMAVNLDGTFHPVMALKDGMIARGFGRIVCISSVAGLRARPTQIAYSASKAAVIGFVRSCAAALAPQIRINAVAPGLIETEMGISLGDEATARLIQATPMGRIGRAEEIAELAAFLLSERASFTSGQTVIASGGREHLP